MGGVGHTGDKWNRVMLTPAASKTQIACSVFIRRAEAHTHTSGQHMSRRSDPVDFFLALRGRAKAILREEGLIEYKKWLDQSYKYPIPPEMVSHDSKYYRAPLLRSEEQAILDKQDRARGGPVQTRLPFTSPPKRNKVDTRSSVRQQGTQQSMDAFLKKPK